MGINPPALPELGMTGGASLHLLDLAGHSEAELQAAVNSVKAAAQNYPEIEELEADFDLSTPYVNFTVNEDKAKLLGVNLDDVYSALQVNFGGEEVNDFIRFGQVYKVVLQADKDFRHEPENMRFLFVRNSAGVMVPLDALVQAQNSSGPASITRYDGVRSVHFEIAPGEDYSTGEAMEAMEKAVDEAALQGFQIAWTGVSRHEREAQGDTAVLLGLSLVFVFLCLAALYESWSVPFAVLLTIPTVLFGAFFVQFALLMLELSFGHFNPGLQNTVYMQIGVIMIMGLAAKNAILIVEFAKVRVDHGMEPVKAAIEAAGLRLRPIIMTSLAFIIGCLPLAMAHGAGAAARNSMGTAVVGGMLFATCLGIFLIPVIYVIVVWTAMKLAGKKTAPPPQPENTVKESM